MKRHQRIFSALGLFAGLVAIKAAAAYAADLTTTAAAGQATLATALPFLQQLAAMPLNLIGVLAFVNVLWGFLVEHGLEHYIMDHVPTNMAGWLKPALPFIAGSLPAIVMGMQGGLAFWPAVMSAFMSGLTATAKHDIAPAQSVTAAAIEAAKPAAQ